MFIAEYTWISLKIRTADSLFPDFETDYPFILSDSASSHLSLQFALSGSRAFV